MDYDSTALPLSYPGEHDAETYNKSIAGKSNASPAPGQPLDRGMGRSLTFWAMDPDIREAHRYCQEITRRRARNFYWAFFLLPKTLRRGLYATYSFCRLSDDIADADDLNEGQKLAGLARVECSLAEVFEGKLPKVLGPDHFYPDDHRIFVALADTIQRWPIPRRYFDEILAGVRQDLFQNRYATFRDLLRYCYHVASTVGLICIEIFGYRGSEAMDRAVDLGIAMQLTNILRDVEEDAQRGRIYLPLEDLARFGVSEEEILTGRTSGGFIDLMAFQVDRARTYFERGLELIPMVLPQARICPMVLASLYRRILDRIELRNYQVFGERIGLKPMEKVAVACGAWFENLVYQPR